MARTKKNKKPSGPKKTDDQRAALKVDRERVKAQRKQEKINRRKNQERKQAAEDRRNGNATVSSKSATTAQTMTDDKLPQQGGKHHNLPFHPDSHILLVGEADFSFARSLVETHNVYSLCATTFDSEAEAAEKYSPQGPENATYIANEGFDGRVFYSIDATKLDTDKQIHKDLADHAAKQDGKSKSGTYDLIIFNFPHIGGKSTDVNRQVRSNQELLVNFFTACKKLILGSSPPSASPLDLTSLPQKTTTTTETTPHDLPLKRTYTPPHTYFTATPSHPESILPNHPTTKILVTLFTSEPYTLWNVRDLARHAGLTIETSFKFEPEAYTGYAHSRTLGNIEGGGGWKGEEREGRCYVFGVRRDQDDEEAGHGGKGKGKKRKKGEGNGESSGEE